MQLHPEGASDLKPFPPVNPAKKYQVWQWACGDEYCECWYIHVMEADDFISEQLADGYFTRALNGHEVWRGTWTSGDDGSNQWLILKAEEKAAMEHFGVKES